MPDLAAALRLFDETTAALEARSRRLEEVLTVKQQQLVEANAALEDKVAELDSLHAYLNLVLESVGSGVVAVDTDGVVTACNPAARLALDAEAEALAGSDYRQIASDSPVWQVLETAAAAGPFERQTRGFGGRSRVITGRGTPLRAADGAVIGAVEVFDDVTDLRRLEQQLERVERLRSLGEMAAGVAHEIRNPLNGIEGFASLLARDLPADAAGRRYADAIIEGVRHLNRTVTGLLEFTRPKEPVKRPVPAVELAVSCLDLVQAEALADAGTAAVASSCATTGDQEVLVPCDGGQIRQVLLNLIQNACQICRQHQVDAPQVVVAIDHDDSWCRWTIDDNGPGVPEVDRHRIFTPFHTAREQGTGLGLAVAHTLVGLHGGRLTVTDSMLGGARFVVEIPLSE